LSQAARRITLPLIRPTGCGHPNAKNLGAKDEGLFISITIGPRNAIGKKWNISVSETFAWFPTTGETNAENVAYRFNRAPDDRGICADQHDVSGVLRVRPGTQDAEEQDFDRTGCVGLRAGTSEEDGEGPFEKRAGSSDDNRIGCEEDVLVLQLVLQQHGPASMPGHLRARPQVQLF